MSYSLENLPRFRKIATAAEVNQAELLPNALIVAVDTEQLFLDTKDKRIDFSAVRNIDTVDDLPEIGDTGKLYITNSGSLFIYAANQWFEYTPYPLAESTYMFRFTVDEDGVEEKRFSSEALGLPHCPEIDLIDSDGYNITNSDFLTRRWVGTEYVLTYSGGFPKGEYFLKLSYNVRFDQQGTYIEDLESTSASIRVRAGENYVFKTPLDSLTIDITGNGKGEASIWFTTGVDFEINLPEDIKFFGATPVFNINTEYVLTIRNNTVAVAIISK